MKVFVFLQLHSKKRTWGLWVLPTTNAEEVIS